jgi:hypothetical protein
VISGVALPDEDVRGSIFRCRPFILITKEIAKAERITKDLLARAQGQLHPLPTILEVRKATEALCRNSSIRASS